MINQPKTVTIGLFGFGVVGSGLYQALLQNPRPGTSIKKVCIRNPEKERKASANLFTTDPNLLLEDPAINLIVELTDDAEAAFKIVSRALEMGKAVITANKKMIAEHLPELLALQAKYLTPLLYEASCCANIPVIRSLEEYYGNEPLQSISGIVNGSTNYILTRMSEDKADFDYALAQAQAEGFAESNPCFDTEGTDAVNKLSILLVHAYGIIAPPAEIVHTGIQHLHTYDSVFAKDKGYEIKLIARAVKQQDGSIAAFVLPQFVKSNHPLQNVKNEYNGIVIENDFGDRQFYYGKGAGSFPTASAVLSDISAFRYGYKYEYKKLYRHPSTPAKDFYLRVFLSCKSLGNVPKEHFERIDECEQSGNRCHVTGIIHFSALLKTSWWKSENVSLIVLPDVFADYRLLKPLKPEEETVFA
ncbi:MAG: homoserine dehydrogenase [Bacteroidota bacterium]|nr:homoserine dehydrogenase [Bacteroidota bacterium]